MDNPFDQIKELWCLELTTEYKNLGFFELAFENLAVTISSHEISSNNIEAEPDDIWMLEIYFGHEILSNMIPIKLLQYIQENSLKIYKIEPKDWVADSASLLSDLETSKFHIIRDLKQQKNHLIPIIINITRAFGTGDHATTLGCIESIEKYCDKQVKSVLDIGTGTGILAISAKKLWQDAEIIATDIDEVALEVASNHAELNKADIKFQMDLPRGVKFDVILANILARPLIEMAENIASLLSKNGIIILSGFLDNQLESIISEYQKYNLFSISVINKDRWITLVLA